MAAELPWQNHYNSADSKSSVSAFCIFCVTDFQHTAADQYVLQKSYDDLWRDFMTVQWDLLEEMQWNLGSQT
jgi:hypothetical protein